VTWINSRTSDVTSRKVSQGWVLGCIALVALLVAGAGVSNTILMAVAERGRKIGVLRAIGASRKDVFQLIWLETIQVCLGGAILGVTIAFFASRSVEAWVRSKLPFAPTDALIHWEGWNVPICLTCAVALGSLAGFLPAWRAAGVPSRVGLQSAIISCRHRHRLRPASD
jgi:ABC-type antimicrobial peptide transport system permease subunit